MEKNLKLNWSMGLRVLMLLIFAMVGLIVTAVLTGISKEVKVVVLFQDIFAFIVPAIAAMMLFYRRPLQQMCLDRAPSWRALGVVVVVSIVSMPAMNWLVDWNQHMHLPDSMKAVENAMRASEDAAAKMTATLLASTSLWPLITTIFVVGFMAGLSEEVFFRGAMLRMTDSGGKSHLAIWSIAIVFSAIHMQFFGFFPRMLLGAWLGYLLIWTRSLWVPIIAHALNNSIVVLSCYLANIGVLEKGAIDNLGVTQNGEFPVLAMFSALCTVVVIVLVRKSVLKKSV